MSSQKGNVNRSRSQKHQNAFKFKNDLHDKTPKAKFLNGLQITDVCGRCKSVLEWKIKYRKYKLLKNPATCTKCSQKNVKLSYRTVCVSCSEKLKICPKCAVRFDQCEPNGVDHHKNDEGDQTNEKERTQGDDLNHTKDDGDSADDENASDGESQDDSE